MSTYLCFVTTPHYTQGAIALALSLHLVGSQATLHCLCTNEESFRTLTEELKEFTPPPPMTLELQVVPLPAEQELHAGLTHGAKGAILSVDAPRRVLFMAGKSFILLDADLIAVQNPDPFLTFPEPGTEKGDGKGDATPRIHAVGNFRLKKGSYGSAKEGGNFNAGVMCVAHPGRLDGEAIAHSVVHAGVDDTEELILNDVFKGRWEDLPRGLNVPKRVFLHAPSLWNEMLEGREIVFVHYMGCKPWWRDAAMRRASDWESERDYSALEEVWWKVREGKVGGGEVYASLPRATKGPPPLGI